MPIALSNDAVPYSQLRATTFVLIALGLMALALAGRNASSMSIFDMTITTTAMAAGAAILFAAVHVPVHNSPLFGAWLAVVLGGGLIAIATAIESSPETPLTHDFFVGLVGVLSTSLWSPLGLFAAALIYLFRKRHDFLSGILCGAVTAVPLHGDFARRDPMLLAYMVLLAACGGWGAAEQRARSVAHRLRTTLPAKVDDFACRTVAKHPRPRPEPEKPGRFRVRVPLKMPSRLRHWWPF